ncbi:MAG: NCS2 family permease [Alphaproteobacteria bacterium]
MFERLFHIEARGSSVRTEIIAGISTFLTMAYIIFVNPSILAGSGMDQGAVFVATCLAAAISCLIMGLYANYPIALAPGMGLNAFFTFVMVKGMGLSWQVALAAVFVSGIIALLVSLSPLREWLINAIPRSMKMAIAAGIGFFLGIIGFEAAGISVAHPATLLTAGDLTKWAVVLASLGFVVIVALDRLRVPGAIIIGVLLVTAAGILLEVKFLDGKAVTGLKGIVDMPPSVLPTLFALDFGGLLKLSIGAMLILIFSLVIADFFDTAGTLVAVSHQAGLLDDDGKLPGLRRALVADSTATAVGALLGTSNTTSYIESGAGIRAGGRTGLTAVVVAILFLLALVFSPLAASIPPYATAPAILFVACMMAKALAEIDWQEPTEYVPAMITALGMPFTFSIATGIGLGFIAYVLIKFLCGKVAETGVAVWLIAAAFLTHFALG